MKTLISYLRTPQSERGSSLIEVVLAAVIMSILGLAIVMVTLGAKPLADRFNAKSVALDSLTFASNQIQQQINKPIQCSFDTTSAKNVAHSLVDQPYLFGNTVTANGRYGFIVAVLEDFTPAINTGSTGYTYTVAPSTLPTGLRLNDNGVIVGTPTSESSSNYVITATKGDSVSKEKINITVIKVVVMIDVSLTAPSGSALYAGSTSFQSCPENNSSTSNQSVASSILTAGSTQDIQLIELSTTSGTTSTTRTIVKLG